MGKTLLLADDSVTIQKVVGISFASQDIEIVTADNGDDAVTKARELRPDIVLADVVMPGKTGYEVCESIKGDPSLQHIPVLLLTGTFEAFDEDRASAAGAAGHIAKPFEAQTLVDRVKDLLAQAPLAPPAAPVAEVPAPGASAGSGDESFDFFDDTLDDFAGSQPAVAASQPAPTAAPADGLDLDGPDAFAFGDDDLGHSDAALDPRDATIAMMPEDGDPPAATVLDPSVLGAAEEPGADDPFSFDFDADAPESTASGLDAGNVANVALLDPDMDSELAVSSSDLLDPQSESTPGFRGLDPDPGDGMALGGDPVMDMLSQPPRDTGVDGLGAAPASQSPAVHAEPMLEAEPLDAGEPLAEAVLEAEPLETVEPLPADDPLSAEPIAMPMPTPEPLAAPPPDVPSPDATILMPAPEPTPPAMEPPPRDAIASSPAPPVSMESPPAPPVSMEAPPPPVAVEAPPAPPVTVPSEPAPQPVAASSERVDRIVAEVTPAMRDELQQTLERIAWESFGAVTEQLVAQALERIETVAWEVVPKLAEALIQEEIRKLKSGD